jgi:hypothetical protein
MLHHPVHCHPADGIGEWVSDTNLLLLCAIIGGTNCELGKELCQDFL